MRGQWRRGVVSRVCLLVFKPYRSQEESIASKRKAPPRVKQSQLPVRAAISRYGSSRDGLHWLAGRCQSKLS